MRASIYEDRLIDININIAYRCIIDGVSPSTEISAINLDNVNVWAKRSSLYLYIQNTNYFRKDFPRSSTNEVSNWKFDKKKPLEIESFVFNS